jgi:formate dehydrogenase (NADP+) beta subunit
VAFGHIDSIGENVLIIGVGNTAMDCCRTSLRLGAKDVKVMARKPRQFFKASAWELEDAEEENVEIVINHSPKEFVVEDGKLKGMTFELMEYDIENGRIVEQQVTGEVFIPCDDVVLAIGQENAFPWIERDLGIEFNKWEEPVVDGHLRVDPQRRVLRRRLGLRAQEHHLGGRARPPGGDLDPPATARASR